MKLNPSQIEADIEAQILQMGRDDYLAGEVHCPFGRKSQAATLWRQGYDDAHIFRYWH